MGLRMVYWKPPYNDIADFLWDVGRVSLEAVYLDHDVKEAAADHGQVCS